MQFWFWSNIIIMVAAVMLCLWASYGKEFQGSWNFTGIVPFFASIALGIADVILWIAYIAAVVSK